MLVNLARSFCLFLVCIFGFGCAATVADRASSTVTTVRQYDPGWCRLGGGRTYRVYDPDCMPSRSDNAVDFVFEAHRHGMERIQELESQGAAASAVRVQLEESGRILDGFHRIVRDACAISAWECRTACEYLAEMRDLSRAYNRVSRRYPDEWDRWFQITEDADVPLACAAESARRAQH